MKKSQLHNVIQLARIGLQTGCFQLPAQQLAECALSIAAATAHLDTIADEPPKIPAEDKP